MSSAEVKRVQVKIIETGPEPIVDKVEVKEPVLESKAVVEEVKEQPGDSVALKIRKQWQLILKVLELILCVLCFALFFKPANQSNQIAKHHLDQVALIFLAFVGYILINLVFIVGRFLKDKIPFKTSALFSLTAALLFFISGILLVVDREHKFQGIYHDPYTRLAALLSAATVFAFINAVLFSVDGVYTVILREDF